MSWLISIGIFILAVCLIIGFGWILDYFDLVEEFLYFILFAGFIGLTILIVILIVILIHKILF